MPQARIRTSPFKPKDDQDLMAFLWSDEIRLNPYNFVMSVFPWGKENTPLEKFSGPRTWQKELLLAVAEKIKNNAEAGELSEELYQAVREAVVSGRGIGKSALVSWLCLWLMTCVLGGTVIVTANTEFQLTKKTFPEISKWLRVMLHSHWFESSGLTIKPAAWFETLLHDQLKIDTRYYQIMGVTWSEENPDAFAGTHNHHGMAVFMDEASGIPKKIWTVTDGFFTEPILHRYHFAFSNGRRNTGEFFECFHKNREFWGCWNIDAREVEGTDKQVYEKIIAENGEDSDEARVEVKGMFPRSGENQFFSGEALADAVERDVVADPNAPLIMAIDVARYGDDASVVAFRQGNDARSIPWREYRRLGLVELAARAIELYHKHNPDAVVVDGVGVGGGLVDILKANSIRVVELNPGSRAEHPQDYINLRCELYDRVKNWLKMGVLPDNEELRQDLENTQYSYRGDDGRFWIESKIDMKKRGLKSPNWGDALIYTFAVRPPRRNARMVTSRFRQVGGADYDVLAI